MSENEKVLYEALQEAREYARFHHRASAWHNDPDAWHLITKVIDPALKTVNPDARPS